MKHIVWKAFWDYENEEKWLNEMSSKGLALVDYTWCRYAFVDSQHNEYIYKLELLKYLPSNPESRKYIEFLEENGTECVATYMRWIYLRRKSSEGDFDIYSDKESKIKHYKRIYSFWLSMMVLELSIGAMNIMIGITNGQLLGTIINTNTVLGVILTVIGLLFLKLSLPIRKKINRLKKEMIIVE